MRDVLGISQVVLRIEGGGILDYTLPCPQKIFTQTENIYTNISLAASDHGGGGRLRVRVPARPRGVRRQPGAGLHHRTRPGLRHTSQVRRGVEIFLAAKTARNKS